MVHNDITTGIAVFNEIAGVRLTQQVAAMVEAGTAAWILDPQVEGVIGLLPSKNGTVTGNSALVVVYIADEDFECDDEFFNV